MNRMVGVMKLHLRDKWGWFFIPWLVLGSSFLVNITVSYFIEDAVYSGGVMSIYIYILVAGILVLAQTFPFALGFNIRRTDFFLGTVLFVTLLSIAFAIVIFLLSVVEHNLTSGWGNGLHFFHLPYVNDGSAIEQLWIYFVLLAHMFFLGFVISSIYRRFGKTGMYVFSIISFLLFSLFILASTYFQWWLDIFHYLSGFTAVELATRMFLLIFIYLLLSFLMLRKATVS